MPLENLETIIVQLLQDVASVKTSVLNIEKTIEAMQKDERINKLEAIVQKQDEEIDGLKNFQTKVLTWVSIIAFIIASIVTLIINKLS